MKNTLPLAAAVAAALLLAGCNQYWERKETVSYSAGDAVAANAAVQIATPWPAGSRNTNITTNGERAYVAFQKYKAGGPSASGSPGSGASAAGAGTSPAPP